MENAIDIIKQSELKANTPVCKMADNERLTVDQMTNIL